jgi:hypothetical protein
LSIRTKLLAGAGSLALAASGLAVAAPAASADQTLVTCTGTRIVALLNPALGSGDAKYTKTAIKRNDAANSEKYHLSLTGAEDFGPSPVDATSCAVDSGIATNNAATNSASGKDNPFDDQTNGQTTLNFSAGPYAAKAKIAGNAAGVASCNRDDLTLDTDYPTVYPLQGKLIYKFGQADVKGKQLQHQFYVRLGTDDADPDITHITVSGIVIKGPGVGGDVSGTFGFGAAYSEKKNLNLLDCTENPAAGNASLGILLINPADGSDVGTAVDPLTVSIPD